MTDYIHEAIKLADGWSITIDDKGEMTSFYAPMCVPKATLKEMSTLGVRLDKVSQQMQDALAAQLVRQVDATDDWFESRSDGEAVIWKRDGSGYVTKANKPNDRTMNTIKAIIDSGVLS